MDLTSNYKKKGMALTDSDKRILRVKRRSVDQKLQRDETFMKMRNIGPLTPLRENTEENMSKTSTTHSVTRQAVLKKPNKSITAASKPTQNKSVERIESAESLARREMLQKWKKEKELKKKLQAEKQKHKPQFKVYKVQQEKRPTINATTSKLMNTTAVSKSQVLKAVPEPQRRVTRSTAKASTSKPTTSQCKPTGPVNTSVNKRTTRQSSRIASKNQAQKENQPAARQQVKDKNKFNKPKPQLDSHKSKPKSLVLTKPQPQPQSKPDPQPEVKPDSKPEVIDNVNLPSPSSMRNVKSERGGGVSPSSDLQKSFAPAHFSFNFQFEPLSPASARSFLFRKGRCSTPMSASRRKRDASPLPLEISVIHSPKRTLNHTPPRQETKPDVSHFRNLLSTETAKLNDLCRKWDTINKETELSDEVSGEIRCTTGKAQLLINQRFKQFSGLVDNCELGLGEKKTHPSDLTGFWDMIYFQIEDVMKMFSALDKFQANNWSKEETKPEPAKKMVKKPKPATKAQLSDKDRTAAKKRLEAVKAAMKARQTRSKTADQIVFEGGFFKVESPVHSPPKHCHAGSPFKIQTNAPSYGNSGTPRIQAYTPKDARRSTQGKICGPLSKLVLGEVATPNRKVTTPQNEKRHKATPARKAETPGNAATLNISDEDLEHVTVVFRPQENANVMSPFAKYLQPSVPPVVNLNEQADDMMFTEPEQQLADLGFGSRSLTFDHEVTAETLELKAGPAQKEELQGHVTDIVIGEPSQAEPVVTNQRPRTRSRCKSGILLAGLGSPGLPGTPAIANKMDLSDVFTPPAVTAVPQMPGDLICFDSPIKSSEGPIPPSGHEASGLPNPRDDVKIPSNRRRSTRLRHHSAFSTRTTDDPTTNSEVPKRPYKPNLSVM